MLRLAQIAQMVEINDNGFVGQYLHPDDRDGFFINDAGLWVSGDWLEGEDADELTCDPDWRIIGFFGRYFEVA